MCETQGAAVKVGLAGLCAGCSRRFRFGVGAPDAIARLDGKARRPLLDLGAKIKMEQRRARE